MTTWAMFVAARTEPPAQPLTVVGAPSCRYAVSNASPSLLPAGSRRRGRQRSRRRRDERRIAVRSVVDLRTEPDGQLVAISGGHRRGSEGHRGAVDLADIAVDGVSGVDVAEAGDAGDEWGRRAGLERIGRRLRCGRHPGQHDRLELKGALGGSGLGPAVPGDRGLTLFRLATRAKRTSPATTRDGRSTTKSRSSAVCARALPRTVMDGPLVVAAWAGSPGATNAVTLNVATIENKSWRRLRPTGCSFILTTLDHVRRRTR